MSLIQLLKFREVEAGLYKLLRFKMPRFQTDIFETGVTVASGQRLENFNCGHIILKFSVYGLHIPKDFLPRATLLLLVPKEYLY